MLRKQNYGGYIMKLCYRALSFLLVFVLIAGLLPAITPAAQATVQSTHPMPKANPAYKNFIAPPNQDPIPADAVWIYTAQQLAGIGGPDSAGKYYVLGNDINLTSEWIPIDDFRGTFNGRGFSINNLFILESSKRENAGLFSRITVGNVIIKNLAINIGTQGVHATDGFFVAAGGIVGRVTAITVSNCFVTGNVTSGAVNPYRLNAGGLIGEADTITINNSYATGNISSLGHSSTKIPQITGTAGGLVGTARGSSKIDSCFSTGNIQAGFVAGGLIGGFVGQLGISNCFTTGDTSVRAQSLWGEVSAGGLVGIINGDSSSTVIRNCYTLGISNGGGLIGAVWGRSVTFAPLVGYSEKNPRAVQYFYSRITRTGLENIFIIRDGWTEADSYPQPGTTISSVLLRRAGAYIRGAYDYLYSPVIDGKTYYLYRIDGRQIVYSSGWFSCVSAAGEHRYLLDENFALVADDDKIAKAVFLERMNSEMEISDVYSIPFYAANLQLIAQTQGHMAEAFRRYTWGSMIKNLGFELLDITVGLLTGNVAVHVLDKLNVIVLNVILANQPFTVNPLYFLQDMSHAYMNQAQIEIMNSIFALSDPNNYSNSYFRNYDEAIKLQHAKLLQNVYFEYTQMYIKYLHNAISDELFGIFDQAFFSALGLHDFDFNQRIEVAITIWPYIHQSTTSLMVDVIALNDPDLMKMFNSVDSLRDKYNNQIRPMDSLHNFSNGALIEDIHSVLSASNSITWDSIRNANSSQSNVTSNLATLPLTGSHGTTIQWSSQNSAISNTGTVTRPAGSTNATGTMRATISKGLATENVNFNLTVVALNSTVQPPADSAEMYANELIRHIHDFDPGGTGDLTATVTGTNEITVTGTVTGVTNMLGLYIAAGVTVKWNADYSGTIPGDRFTNPLIHVGGEGDFVMTGGTVVSGGDFIHAWDDTLITVSGGTITTAGGGIGSTSDIIIEGGTIVTIGDHAQTLRTWGDGSITVRGASAVVRAEGDHSTTIMAISGTITVEDGTVTNTGNNGITLRIEDSCDRENDPAVTCGKPDYCPPGAVVVSGGTVTASGAHSTAIIAHDGNVTVSGGEIMGTGSKAIWTEIGNVTVSGTAQVTTTADGSITIENQHGNITVSGGTVTNSGNTRAEPCDHYWHDACNFINVALLTQGGAIKVSGGTVVTTGTDATAILGWDWAESPSIEISGGTVRSTGVYGWGIVIPSQTGEIIISGGLVETTHEDAITVLDIFRGTLTITGGTVKSAGAVNVFTSEGNITITGGTLESAGEHNIINQYGTLTISGDAEIIVANIGVWSDTGTVTVSGNAAITSLAESEHWATIMGGCGRVIVDGGHVDAGDAGYRAVYVFAGGDISGIDEQFVTGVIYQSDEHDNYPGWQRISYPSCVATGLEEATCLQCGHHEIRPIPAQPCGVCSICRPPAPQQPEQPAEPEPEPEPCATGHIWGEWEITTPATSSANGIETRTCSVCDEAQIRPITKTISVADGEETAFIANNTLNEIRQERLALEVMFTDEDGEPAGSIVFSPAAAAQMISDSTTGVGINVSLRAVEVDIEELSEEQAAIVEDRPVFNLSVTIVDANERPITQFGGSVTVTVPYTLREGETNANAIVVYYLAPDGTLKMERGRYIERDGMGWVSFTVTHFSGFVITYNFVEFTDIDEDHGNYDAIVFIAARGITVGMGDGSFGPDSALTRAQLLAMIMRAFGIEAEEGLEEYKFDDAEGRWYDDYTATARKLGITFGIGNNLFGFDRPVTREEMMLFVYRSLGVLGELDLLAPSEDGKDLDDFEDAGDISNWVYRYEEVYKIEAVLKSGIYSGDELLPRNGYERALMAQLLFDLLTR
jgi:hypothetical protein